MALPLIAAGAVGLLAWTAYKAYRKESARLEEEDRRARVKAAADDPKLERDPQTGRYRLPKSADRQGKEKRRRV